MNRIRVMILDDVHQQLGWRPLLVEKPEIELLNFFPTSTDAIQFIRHLHPDVVVVDTTTAKENLLESIRPLVADSLETRLLVITPDQKAESFEQPEGELEVRFLNASSVSQDLLATIVALAADGLSERERDVMRMIARGYTNKEIASKLDLSVKTVEKYKARSADKLGLRSRVQIVQYAIDRGWMAS